MNMKFFNKILSKEPEPIGMQVFKSISGSTSYPVGSNIAYNMPVITSMGFALLALIEDCYKDKTLVHLVCKGSSGAIISALVSSILMNREGLIVRIQHVKKDGEESHSSNGLPETLFDINSVVVVIDDFICTGDTVHSLIEAIECVSMKTIDVLCVSGHIPSSLIAKNRFTYGLESI